MTATPDHRHDLTKIRAALHLLRRRGLDTGHPEACRCAGCNYFLALSRADTQLENAAAWLDHHLQPGRPHTES